MILLFGLYESLKEFQGLFTIIIAVVGTVYLVKSGIIQELTGGQKKLTELYKNEKEQACRDRDAALLKVKELEEYNRLIILDSRTRMQIELQKGEK